MDEEQVKNLIRQELAQIFGIDKYTFTRDIQISNGRNIQVGKSVGTLIGTESTQKLGFYGKTPIVRPTASSSSSAFGIAYDQTQAETVRTSLNDVRQRLSDLGLTA